MAPGGISDLAAIGLLAACLATGAITALRRARDLPRPAPDFGNDDPWLIELLGEMAATREISGGEGCKRRAAANEQVTHRTHDGSATSS